MFQSQKFSHLWDNGNNIKILLDFINQSLPSLPASLFDPNQTLTEKDMDQLSPEQCKQIVSLIFQGKTACGLEKPLSSSRAINSSNIDAALEPETQKTIKRSDDSFSKDAQDNLPPPSGPANQLGEDELLMIFTFNWLSTQDLLNFRSVNKIWHDAATATLLRRDACCVEFNIDNNWKEAQSCIYKYGGKKTDANKLSQLTDLVSNSRKFPASFFCMRSSGGVPYDYLSDYTNYPDLLLFFELHGDTIKTLRPHGKISKKLLLDILFNYTPSLDCLDLTEANDYLKKKRNVFKEEKNERNTQDRVLPFKSLRLLSSNLIDEIDSDGSVDANSNPTAREPLHLLLSSPSNLSFIEDVELGTLEDVMREGKEHLIRSFTCTLDYVDGDDESLSFAAPILKFVRLNPKLSTIHLSIYEKDDTPVPNEDLVSINALIQFSKDTLQNVSLCCHCEGVWYPKLKISPMKQLKSISLSVWAKFDRRTEFVPMRDTIFAFEGGISAENYFPSLINVSLNIPRFGGYTITSQLRFFGFGSDEDRIVWGIMSKVEILTINGEGDRHWFRTDQRSSGIPLLSEMFPNVRTLRIQCTYWKNLENVWGLCPKVEFLEIYNIKLVALNRLSYADEVSVWVDKLFTGFSLEMCQKLRTSELLDETRNPDMLNLLRITPSICQLTNLKELKLRFIIDHTDDSPPCTFGSRVTGAYAFSKMPNTRFIISYEPTFDYRRDFSEAEWESRVDMDEEVMFGPIKPYVQFISKKRYYY